MMFPLWTLAGMSFSSIISFGTERFPEGVARRLRVVNMICWISAASLMAISIRRFAEGNPNWGLEAATGMLVFGAIPLLHRFGSSAALLTLIVLAFIDTWRVTADGGTAGGYWLAYVVGGALAVLLIGPDRPLLAALLACLGGVGAIAIHLAVPAATGVQSPEDQFYSLLINIGRTQVLLFAVAFFGARQLARAEMVAAFERDRSDALLSNMLPAAIADRLKKQPEKKVADRYDAASVLFADMAGFTKLTETMTPDALVVFLDGVFSKFDRLVEAHDLEKIKTSGDGYMVVSGVPEARPDHAEAMTRLALAMMDEAEHFEHGVKIRIGIASGPVVAGVVGSKRFFYDIWGDAVNLAARMEQTGETGRVHVTAETARLLQGSFNLEARGLVSVKGKGEIETFFVSGPAE